MQAIFVYSPDFLRYDLGPEHPLKAARYQQTYELLKAYQVFREGVSVVEPRWATEEEVLWVHTPEYVEVLKRLEAGETLPLLYHYGLGTGDNPIFPELWTASLIYTGASLTAAELILERKTQRADNISGGLHHALPNKASGFCYLNDPAIAIVRLLQEVDRVVYIDTDAHHGDGVERIFYRDPRVLTISFHESGRYLFPGTGEPEDIGEGPGRGYSANVPLAPYTDDDTFLWAFNEVVPPLIQWFQPQVIVTQFGADAHHTDPLTHLNLTTQAYEKILAYYDQLNLPWLLLGGGGYARDTVPRVWALAFAAQVQVSLPDPLPEDYLKNWDGSAETLRDSTKVEPPSPNWVAQFARESVRRLQNHLFRLHKIG